MKPYDVIFGLVTIWNKGTKLVFKKVVTYYGGMVLLSFFLFAISISWGLRLGIVMSLGLLTTSLAWLGSLLINPEIDTALFLYNKRTLHKKSTKPKINDWRDYK